MNKKALSLIEVLIATVIGTFVILGITAGLRFFSNSQNKELNKENVEFALAAAVELIERVGRVSRVCEKMIVGTDFYLRCQIDFTRPATGNLSWVRFIHVGTDLRYEQSGALVNPQNFGGPNRLLQTFPYVKEFHVCDFADMTETGGIIPCPLEPQELSRVTTAAGSAADGVRLFRYRLDGEVHVNPKGRIVSAGASNVQSYNFYFQGAFFVRNLPGCPIGTPCFSW